MVEEKKEDKKEEEEKKKEKCSNSKKQKPQTQKVGSSKREEKLTKNSMIWHKIGTDVRNKIWTYTQIEIDPFTPCLLTNIVTITFQTLKPSTALVSIALEVASYLIKTVVAQGSKTFFFLFCYQKAFQGQSSHEPFERILVPFFFQLPSLPIFDDLNLLHVQGVVLQKW